MSDNSGPSTLSFLLPQGTEDTTRYMKQVCSLIHLGHHKVHNTPQRTQTSNDLGYHKVQETSVFKPPRSPRRCRGSPPWPGGRTSLHDLFIRSFFSSPCFLFPNTKNEIVQANSIYIISCKIKKQNISNLVNQLQQNWK